jgi:tetratricopeptide (TPR) repeat protein
MKQEQGVISYHRKASRLTIGIISVLVLIALSMAGYFLFTFLRTWFSENYSIKDLYQMWGNGEYGRVYEISDKMLLREPFNNALLTLNGYASFFLAVADTDPRESQAYLDHSINAMRIALDRAPKTVAPQLEYMLGKAYYFKDSFSSWHYYADLTVKYLQRALESGYVADDISEYLGLSYAALGMIRESIATFTEALQKRDSDVLLLAIAEQYSNNNQYASAKPYLFRLNSRSQNEVLLLKSHQLLGQMYRNEKQYDEAMKEFQFILENDPNNADAYYEIGVLYEELDNGLSARSRHEFRQALRIQPNHVGAGQKFANDR